MFGTKATGPATNTKPETSFDELLMRKHNLDQEIAERQDTEVEGLKTKVFTVASALGITVAELFGIKTGDQQPRKRKQKLTAKYRDPEQPENTWTGKGRAPKWLQEKLDLGATKDEFLA